MIDPVLMEGSSWPGEHEMEIVERKGLGHPDTVCDAVMESVAVHLAQAYLKICGRVLHFNADKALLVAGQADYRFGGGKIVKPMRLVMGDRASWEWKNKRIPVARIAERAAFAWLKKHLPRITPSQDIQCQVELGPAPAELQSALDRQSEAVANDTSAAVGYAPLSPTERLVLHAEQFLNSRSFKREFPDTGQDVKVLGVRTGRHLALTVAMPFVATAIMSEREYFQRKDAVERALKRFALAKAPGRLISEIHLNTLDRRGCREAGAYLTLLGTSAEGGDSGEVGRGNRVTGLISLFRPAGSEAAAGKNPVAHVGKIYGLLAQVLAEAIQKRVQGVRHATVWITSQIGKPVSEPQCVAVEVVLSPGKTLDSVRSGIRREVHQAFTHLPAFCRALVRGIYPVC